jgi:DinB superfamily
VTSAVKGAGLGGRRPVGVPPLAAEDHVCKSCGIRYSQVTVEAALSSIYILPKQLRATLSRFSDDDALHVRPEAETWSVVEYVCHIRDVLAATTIRLHRTRTENHPVVDPMLNDLRADRFAYNRRSLLPLFDEVADMTDGLLREAARTSGSGWDRTHCRYRGEDRSARWLVRQAMHEATHHLQDIAQITSRIGSHQ